MRLEATLRDGRGLGVGTLRWDSDTGEISGSYARVLRRLMREALRRGFVDVPTRVPGSDRRSVSDIAHRPEEMADFLRSILLELPPELVPFFRPVPPPSAAEIAAAADPDIVF